MKIVNRENIVWELKIINPFRDVTPPVSQFD